MEMPPGSEWEELGRKRDRKGERTVSSGKKKNPIQEVERGALSRKSARQGVGLAASGKGEDPITQAKKKAVKDWMEKLAVGLAASSKGDDPIRQAKKEALKKWMDKQAVEHLVGKAEKDPLLVLKRRMEDEKQALFHILEKAEDIVKKGLSEKIGHPEHQVDPGLGEKIVHPEHLVDPGLGVKIGHPEHLVDPGLGEKIDHPEHLVDLGLGKKIGHAEHLVDPMDVDYAEECLGAEAMAGWERKKAEYEKVDEERGSDIYALQAEEFYAFWTTRARRFGFFGSFEATTKIPPMRFTDRSPPPNIAYPCETLQIYSVKVAGIRGGLQWPLDVFGLIAMRDCIDHNRNVIFNRTRDNCQSLTKMDPYLVLIGPIRAVMLLDPVTVEVVLKVKGATESEDKDLSFLAVPLIRCDVLDSRLLNTAFTSKLSTLEFALGHIVYSLEATIFVQVIDGSWPGCFGGQFSARALTACISDTDDEEVFSHCEDEKVPVIGDGSCASSIDNQVIILLDSGVGKVPVSDDGKIKLSRCVVSVEGEGKLIVSVKAWQTDNKVVETEKDFIPKEADRSRGMLDVGFCKMEVTVAWSLISHDPTA